METITIITNKRRVSKLIGIESIRDRKFEREYNEYFNDTSIEKLNEFYEKTGLKLTNIYKLKEAYNKKSIDSRYLRISELPYDFSEYMIEKISFNSLGSSIDSPFENDIYGQDIIAIHEVDEIWIRDNKVVVDGKEIYTLYKNKEIIELENRCSEIRYELSFTKNIDEKNKIIHDNYDSEYEIKGEVKQIYLSPFGELFVLYNDGLLYMQEYGKHVNLKYAENVAGIWEANTYNCYLIFKDNYVEFLASKSFYCHEKKYDKVIFKDNYLALLKDKELEVISKSEDSEENYHSTFNEIDDIDLGEYESYLKIKKQDEYIIFNTNILSER